MYITEEMYRKYKNLNIPLQYSIEEISNIYLKKYNAVEIDKKFFIDLKKDPYVNYSKIVKCFVINDKKILDHLFSKEEKEHHLEFRKEISQLYPEEDFVIEEGRLLNIILESDDNNTISSFTLQGKSDKIFYELIVFKGIKNEDIKLDNINFQEYLQALVQSGYIIE